MPMRKATSCTCSSARSSEENKARASVTECFRHRFGGLNLKPARTSYSYLICRADRKQTGVENKIVLVTLYATAVFGGCLEVDGPRAARRSFSITRCMRCRNATSELCCRAAKTSDEIP